MKVEAWSLRDPRQLHRSGAGRTRASAPTRRWIYESVPQFQPAPRKFSDPYKVQKEGRIFRDVEVVNVVAVLPGTSQPEKRVIVGGHYDSLNIVMKPGAGDFRSSGDGATDSMDNEASAIAPAPGVGDDASGTAVVMELARVMSQYKFEKTIVFVAFAGEEIGLVGSSLYADKAKAHGDKIEAVLNNDIVGYDVTGAGPGGKRIRERFFRRALRLAVARTRPLRSRVRAALRSRLRRFARFSRGPIQPRR